MSKTKQYSPEVKERAVRMVQEARNHQRLLEPIGYIPPAEAEDRYYLQLTVQAEHART